MSDEDFRALERIHNDGFGPEERQFTAELMRKHAGRDGYRLFLAELKRAIVGYIFVQVIPAKGVCYLWYTAVDEKMRGRGLGGTIMRKTLEIIEREHTEVRLVLLESHCPEPEEPLDGWNRRRIEFYRRLGAHHITGINYGVPAADDPTNLIHYDILYFEFGGAAKIEFVRDAVADMMRGNLKPDDARVKPMLKSLKNMRIIAPPDVTD